MANKYCVPGIPDPEFLTRLLYSDRDFDPFVEHLDLRSAMVEEL